MKKIIAGITAILATISCISGCGQESKLVYYATWDGIDKNKVIVNITNNGNTSAASIPLALSQNIANGTIKKGDIIALTAMGAGFTWGGAIIRI